MFFFFNIFSSKPLGGVFIFHLRDWEFDEFSISKGTIFGFFFFLPHPPNHNFLFFFSFPFC